MIGIALLSTLAAWFLGLVLDANIDLGAPGILGLRILFPILAMGTCILLNQNKSKGEK